ncbi:CRISPR-associated endoribonuclease Cas6 [Sporolactobacillus sp. KGMB 08714]|uniref:CRISPR-associated endoribonuclease Cas6 n=1 Tax=Sporolactobacillus sp. KGMB 08714 TaxID=3064704 RepID=UPI002FBED9B8
MRARLIYSIKNFPITYRLLLLSLIKESIRKEDPSFYEELFVVQEKKTKPFSLAAYFPNIRIVDDQITSDTLYLTVSADTERYPNFIVYLFNALHIGQIYSHNGTTMQLRRIEFLREKRIDKSLVWFKTCSPILVEDKQGQPLLANDPRFSEELSTISNKVVLSVLGRPLYQPLVVEKHALRKVVIKENFHQNFDGPLYFTANAGKLLLSGDPCDLNFFYHTAIGLRSQFFGLLDKID